MNYGEQIVTIARSHIGLTEVSGNLGFHDPEFQKELEQMGWKKTYAWCTFFANRMWYEAYQETEFWNRIKGYFSPLAVVSFHRFEDAGMILPDLVLPGALVYWQHYSKGLQTPQGHAGIYTGPYKFAVPFGKVRGPEDGFLSAEGNTIREQDKGNVREGYIVAERKHTFDAAPKNGLRLLGFVNPVEL
jgi:hypothetical protein